MGLQEKSLQFIEQSVAHWLMSLGALCMLLPTVPSEKDDVSSTVQMRDYADHLDGLILQGGLDIDPALYGELPTHIIGDVDPVRDRCELELIRAFTGQGKPILGICRGMQLINVAFGGSLHQDLVAQGITSFPHVNRDQFDRHHHMVELADDDVFQQWYGGIKSARVNSIHHQGVARLGEGLKPVAVAPDGVVEAIRHEGESFVLGVQWHPEYRDDKDAGRLSSGPMLQAFLDAAARRRDGCLARAS